MFISWTSCNLNILQNTDDVQKSQNVLGEGKLPLWDVHATFRQSHNASSFHGSLYLLGFQDQSIILCKETNDVVSWGGFEEVEFFPGKKVYLGDTEPHKLFKI